ncbi:MAG: hypothetical protein AB7E47_01365 [Desulfovibrionaceae bacterium]
MNTFRTLLLPLFAALLLPAVAHAAPWAAVRYAHDVVNVRAARTTEARVVARLEPGQKVVASFPLNDWLAVFSPDKSGHDLSEAMGYVFAALLHPAPPEAVDATAPQAAPGVPVAAWNGTRLHARARTNVRAARSVDAGVVAQLERGEAVLAAFPKDHWLAVFRPGQDMTGTPLGYVFADLLTDAPPAAADDDAGSAQPSTPARTPETASGAASGAASDPLAACGDAPGSAPVERFVVAAANLRAAPSTDAPIAAWLPRGQRLLVTPCTGDWNAVLAPESTPPQVRGYVHVSLLTPAQPTKMPDRPIAMRARVRANLRAARSLHAAITGVLEPGRRVVAGFCAHDWCAVFSPDAPTQDERLALGFAFAPLLEADAPQDAAAPATADAKDVGNAAATAAAAPLTATAATGEDTAAPETIQATALSAASPTGSAAAANQTARATTAPQDTAALPQDAAPAATPQDSGAAATPQADALPQAQPASSSPITPTQPVAPETPRATDNATQPVVVPQAVQTEPPATQPAAPTAATPAVASGAGKAPSAPAPGKTAQPDSAQPDSAQPAAPKDGMAATPPTAQQPPALPAPGQPKATPEGGTLMTATATINVRAARSTESAIVKMIEQGREVMAAFPKSGWFAVFEPSQEATDEQYAMGYVYASLLKPATPGDRPLVGVPADAMPRPPAHNLSPQPDTAPAPAPPSAGNTGARQAAPAKAYALDNGASLKTAPHTAAASGQPSTAAAPPTPQPGHRLYATGVANVRSGPTTASRITRRLEKGAAVLAAAPLDNWCAVYPPGSDMRGEPTGYVYAPLLAPLPPETDTPQGGNAAPDTTLSPSSAAPAGSEQKAEGDTLGIPHKILEEHQEGPARMVSILLEVDTLPDDERLKRLGQRLWFKMMAACDILHLYIYLPGLDIMDPAYGVATFSKTEPATFRTRQSVLYGTRWSE